MSRQEMGQDQLLVIDGKVTFIKANGETLDMPNLTKMIAMYEAQKDNEIGNRVKEILTRGIGTLLIAEVMVDMTNETTLARFENGEISKTMRHVNTYNIVLESHLEAAKEAFDGDFNTCVFAEFPYGIVIEREKYPTYKNTTYCVEDIRKIIEV
ncbi:MAG: hypothetical protein ACRCTE_01350 [Cellulosilyticaceae bacterium]